MLRESNLYGDLFKCMAFTWKARNDKLVIGVAEKSYKAENPGVEQNLQGSSMKYLPTPTNLYSYVKR